MRRLVNDVEYVPYTLNDSSVLVEMGFYDPVILVYVCPPIRNLQCLVLGLLLTTMQCPERAENKPIRAMPYDGPYDEFKSDLFHCRGFLG